MRFETDFRANDFLIGFFHGLRDGLRALEFAHTSRIIRQEIDIKRPEPLEPPEIVFTDLTSDIIVSPEKSRAFIETLLHPISNPNRDETLKKIDAFFKDKKIPFKIKLSDLDNF